MRKALLVGINYYPNSNSLFGCVNDAYEVKSVLERNGDGSINFDVMLLTSDSEKDSINRGELKDSIEDLFNSEVETALFYFAGHGHIEATGVYLLA